MKRFLLCIVMSVAFFALYYWAIFPMIEGEVKDCRMRWVCLVGGYLVTLSTVGMYYRAVRLRQLTTVIKTYSDDAYDFFLELSDKWMVFDAGLNVISPAERPKGCEVGPIEFSVPKRGHRIVAVFGLKGSYDSLERLFLRIRVKDR